MIKNAQIEFLGPRIEYAKGKALHSHSIHGKWPIPAAFKEEVS